MVTHGITFISRLQLWTQPFWLLLHLLPFVFIAFADPQRSSRNGRNSRGIGKESGNSFNLALFGAASSVLFSLIAQIGEQVDFLRFLPVQQPEAAARLVGRLSVGRPGLDRARHAETAGRLVPRLSRRSSTWCR